MQHIIIVVIIVIICMYIYIYIYVDNNNNNIVYVYYYHHYHYHYFASRDLDMLVGSMVCGSFAENCGDLRRFAETVIFHCKMTNKYCGDLRRRRIRAKRHWKISKSPGSRDSYGNLREQTGEHVFHKILEEYCFALSEVPAREIPLSPPGRCAETGRPPWRPWVYKTLSLNSVWRRWKPVNSVYKTLNLFTVFKNIYDVLLFRCLMIVSREF